MQEERISPKDFMNKILSGAATGIVVGLIPGAILGEIFKALADVHPVFAMFSGVLTAIQFTVPVLVGMFTALQFNFTGIKMASMVAAAWVGSGAPQLVDGNWELHGTGDLINTMIVVSLSALVIIGFNDRWPSLNIVVIPVIAGAFPGLIGLFTLPAVSKITDLIGALVERFTTLQPLLMMVLIAIVFALVIVSPLSTVAIAYAISISGLAAGAANLGIVATVFTLAYGSYKVNKAGTTIALFFGGPKLMMANYLQNPIMNVPIIINAAVTGLFAYLFKIPGTTASAGFGITGLAGPINAFSLMDGSPLAKILILIVQYVVVPLGIAIITHEVFTRMGLYSEEIYENDPSEGV